VLVVVALRRTLRAYSWIALVALLYGWMLPFADAHPFGRDDAACLAVDESTSSKVADASADLDQPAHCVICHLMRAINGAVPVDVATLAVPVVAIPQPMLATDAALTVAFAPPSSRGPPAAL
jgi:hypothetical protein